MGTLLCLLALLGTAFAQLPQIKKPKPPRALALVEWPAKGQPRVVPICILVDGQFYDASVYLADPVPLALDPGNVYEVEQSGDPVGFVTITQPLLPQGGNWFADASFRSKAAITAAAARKTEPPMRAEQEEGPPRLRREKPSDTAAPAPKPAAETKPAESKPPADEDRPVLRRPGEQAPAAKPPAPATQAPPETANVPAEPEGRPILRRGSSGPEQAVALPGSVQVPSGAHISTSSTGLKTAAVTSAPPVRVLPAVSDTGGPQPEPYVFHWTPDEQTKLTAGMQSLAQAALQKYAAQYGGYAGALENVEVRAFDLTYGNEPVLVLSAAAQASPAPAPRRTARAAHPSAPASDSAPDLTYWITLLAREDLNGDLRLLKSWATDSKHLDAFPRRELIDAVDADGDGQGDLLFRLIWDHGRDFAVDRVRYDQVTELYNSGRQ